MPYTKGEECEGLSDYESLKKCGERVLTLHLYKSLKYPAIARENELEGMALLQFTINKDGTVEDIEAMRGLCKEIEAECIRVIESMPEWMPGKHEGKAVRVRFTLPVIFKLQ